MIRRSTVVVVILFLLLLAVAFYLQKNPLPTTSEITPTPTEQAKLLPDIVTKDITSLELQQKEGENIRVTADGQGNWLIETDGNRASSSPGKVEQARDELASALVTAALPADYSLDAVGLSDPQSTIIIWTSSGDQYTIRIGNKTPTRNGIYLQVGKAPPVVVDDAVIETTTSLLIQAAASPEATGIVTETPVP